MAQVQNVGLWEGSGLTVADEKAGWGELTQFAQKRVEANKGARAQGRVKNKVVRELQTLKSLVNYERGPGRAEGSQSASQILQKSKVVNEDRLVWSREVSSSS